jgi:hypothetical protein
VTAPSPKPAAKPAAKVPEPKPEPKPEHKVELKPAAPAPAPAPAPKPEPKVELKPAAPAPETSAKRSPVDELRAMLQKLQSAKSARLIVPVAVAVLGLVMLGFVASRPVPQAVEVTQVTLEEGESRMVTIAFEQGVSPLELKTGAPETVEISIFLRQKEEGLLHVLVTGVTAGETTWSVVTDEGRTLAYRTQVRPVPPRSTREADKTAAMRKIEEGDLLMKELDRELSNPHQAIACYREAAAILGGQPYGKVDPAYQRAATGLEQATRAWRSAYARAEGEFQLAKLNGDTKGVRQALTNLLTIAPEDRSVEFQKNATLLNYVYGGRRKKATSTTPKALLDESSKESE